MDLGGIAVGVAASCMVSAAQLWLKFTSRVRKTPDQPWRSVLTREDFTWWIDWIVSACVALAAFVITSSAQAGVAAPVRDPGEPPLSNLVLLLIAILVSGASVLPTLVNRFGYDMPTDNSPEEPVLRMWRGVVLPNIAAAIILIAVVAAGVSSGGLS